MESTKRQAVYWGIGLILVALLLAILAGAVEPTSSTTYTSPWGWMGGMMGGYGFGGWGGGLMMTLGMLAMVAFWVGIILLAVWAVREFLPRSQATSGSPSALDIAKARYARGEISKAEFEELKKDLV